MKFIYLLVVLHIVHAHAALNKSDDSSDIKWTYTSFATNALQTELSAGALGEFAAKAKGQTAVIQLYKMPLPASWKSTKNPEIWYNLVMQMAPSDTKRTPNTKRLGTDGNFYFAFTSNPNADTTHQTAGVVKIRNGIAYAFVFDEPAEDFKKGQRAAEAFFPIAEPQISKN